MIAPFHYKISAVTAFLARFEVKRHKQQLLRLDIWQHCHRHFLLLCLPAESQQFTFLATVYTLATRVLLHRL